jgi:hypothetical protein
MLALALAGGSAVAGLGGRPVAGGDTSMQAMASPAGTAYQQQTSRLESGTTVRQFINGDGVVFAVSWSGPFLPDLRELLGDHFTALREGESTARGRSSALSISRPDLVLVSTGHMGAFQGRAWLPGQLPAGFDPGTMP